MASLAVIGGGEYFFQARTRWALVWDSPNEAGLVLACIIPFLWVGAWPVGRGLRGAVLLAVEAMATFALVRTYSRGAVMAFAVALLAFGFWRIRLLRQLNWNTLAPVVLRVVVIVLLLGATHFSARLMSISGDAGVASRWRLLRGGCGLVAASPWSGWGMWAGGRNYSNWFSGENEDPYSGTLINTYLEVAAAYGVPALALLLTCIGSSFSAGVMLLRSSRAESNGQGNAWLFALARGAHFSLIAFAVGIAFSTFVSPTAIGLLVILVGLPLVCAWRRGWRIARAICLWTSLSVVVSVGLVGVGRWVQRQSGLCLRRTSEGVCFGTPAEPAAPEVAVLSDRSVLGLFPGRVLRSAARLRQNQQRPMKPVLLLEEPTKLSRSFSTMLACGARWREFPSNQGGEGDHRILLHPTGFPEGGRLPRVEALYLPEVPEQRDFAQWQKWATDRQIRTNVSRECGLDAVTPAPGILAEEIP